MRNQDAERGGAHGCVDTGPRIRGSRSRTVRMCRGALLSGLLIAAGCAGGPPPDVVSPERDAAVRFALAGRAFAVSLAKQCRFDPSSGRDLSPLAQAALAAWEERNQANVEAARLYLNDAILVFARRSGRRAAADRERQLAAEQSADGTRAANRTLEESGGRENCALLLDQLRAGALDFQDAYFDPILAELRERYGQVASEPPAP